jgi:hypothetical protein
MNWPKSIGWLKGPMSDGRKDRDSTALASLAITACHAPGIAMFTAAAARERTMSTVPTRAATARWRSVQSSWATAHPNSRPLAMTNVPVRKIAAGTWRTSALSTPQTRKPANHHCPGRLRSGRLPTIRRSGIVTAHSTTRPSSRYPTWGICTRCSIGRTNSTANAASAAVAWGLANANASATALPSTTSAGSGQAAAAPPRTTAASAHTHTPAGPGGAERGDRRAGPLTTIGGASARADTAVTATVLAVRASPLPSSTPPRRPRSTLPCREPAGLAPAGRGSCSTPTGSEHTRPQVPVVPRLG